MSIFALTTALLTPDFVENFDPEKLASKFVRVEQDFDVKFNKLNSSFVIIGDWKSVQDARNSLLKLISDENKSIQSAEGDNVGKNLKINDSKSLSLTNEKPGFVKTTGNPTRGRHAAPDKRFANVPEPVFFLQYQDQTFTSAESLDMNAVLDDYEKLNYNKSVKKEDLKKIFKKNKDQMGKPLEKGIPKGAIIPSSKVCNKRSSGVSQLSSDFVKVNDSTQHNMNNQISGSAIPLLENTDTSNILVTPSGQTSLVLDGTLSAFQSSVTDPNDLLNNLPQSSESGINHGSSSKVLPVISSATTSQNYCTMINGYQLETFSNVPVSTSTCYTEQTSSKQESVLSQSVSSMDLGTNDTHQCSTEQTLNKSDSESRVKASSQCAELNTSSELNVSSELNISSELNVGSELNVSSELNISSELNVSSQVKGSLELNVSSTTKSSTGVDISDACIIQTVSNDVVDDDVIPDSKDVSENVQTVNYVSNDVGTKIEENNCEKNETLLLAKKGSNTGNSSITGKQPEGENKKAIKRKKQKKITSLNEDLMEEKLKSPESDGLKTKARKNKKEDPVPQDASNLHDNPIDNVTQTTNDLIIAKDDKTTSKEPPCITARPSGDIIYKCTVCDYQGHRKRRLSEHMGRVHGLLINGKAVPSSSFKCDACNKVFVFQKDLNRHNKIVHHGESYTCMHCLKSYKSQYVYERHLATHEEGYIQPKFKCQICEKEFTTKFSLSSHVKSEHLGVKKTYCCPICCKTFSQIRSYRQHANVHAGIRPYTCEICGKSFTYDKSLKEHRYMHDTIRRFQCSICSKAFRQQTCLLIHMKTHKKKKDHMCSVCGREFTQKQSLLRHERIHTGDKPYTCKICNKSFGDQAVIRKHVMMAHKRSKEAWKNEIYTEPKEKSSHYVEGGPGYVPREYPSQKLDNCLTGMVPPDTSHSLIVAGDQSTEQSNQNLLNNFQTLYSMPNFRVDLDTLSSLRMKQENLTGDGTSNDFSTETNSPMEQFNVNLSDPTTVMTDPIFSQMMKKMTSVNDEAYAAQFLNLPVGSGNQSVQQTNDDAIQYSLSSVSDSTSVTGVTSSSVTSNVTTNSSVWNFPGYSSSLYSPASYQYQ